MRPTRSILCAANEDDDSVFRLLECREAEFAAETTATGTSRGPVGGGGGGEWDLGTWEVKKAWM